MTADALLLRAVQGAEEVETRGMAFLNSAPAVFERTSHRIPHLMHPELGFIRISSWLFVLYFEVGRIGTNFLEEHMDGYQIDADKAIRIHRTRVQDLRTYLQHNLDFSTTHDQNIFATCLGWFREACGTAVPKSEDEWMKCVERLLEEAGLYLGSLSACLRSMEQDEVADSIREAWILRRTRYHAPHQFDALIPIVASDMGRDFIDVIAFRKRNYDLWVSRLKGLTTEYSFDIEARKLIEDTLMKDPSAALPITGADIITHLGVAPGPEVGRWLVEARKLYNEQPCTKAVLLERLAACTGQESDGA